MAREQFGCAACIPAIAVKATALRLVPTVRLIDESHFGVSLRTCPSCQQAFLWVFCEQVDWVKGEDPQCTTVLPLTSAEAATVAAAGEGVDLSALSTLALTRRFLRSDWPSGAEQTCAYVTGTLVGIHD